MNIIKKSLLASVIAVSLTGCGATGDDLLGSFESNKDYFLTDLSGLDFSDYEVSSPVKELAKKDVSQAKTVGAVIGGIAGIVACEAKISQDIIGRSLIVTGCIAASAYGGDQLGAYVGSGIALRRLKYATEYEFLESEIEASKTAITAKEAQLAEYEQEISKIELEVGKLQQSNTLTKAQINSARSMKEQVESKLEDNEKLEQSYEDTLAYLDSLLISSNELTEDNRADEAKKVQEIAKLKKERSNLAIQMSEIQNHSVRLRSSRTVLQNVAP